ncbi:enoyl-CoA hydratase-related protein [Patulibacter sp. NPDC049589]|uniref:enoyl-CoA hydratase/isomerase family protein n=1 Tax=Patulibacter sp. NPDC049589 TaxID=3154731 RepID=UPI003412BDBA
MTDEVPADEAPRAELVVADGVATITLRDPGKVNAINARMAGEFRAAVEEANGRDDVGAIVTLAEGKSWCMGGAVGEFVGLGDGVPDFVRLVGEDLNPLVEAIHRSPKVTVAGVHGPIAGAGIGLMAAHDLVIADPRTSISVAYHRLGLTPDAGVSYFMTRDLGYRRALELYLSDETLRADDALAAGLFTRLSAEGDVHAEASALAARHAAGPRSAHATTKRLYRQVGDGLLEEQVADEIRSLAEETRTSDFREGLQAMLERRSPVFGGTPAGAAGS